MVKNGELQPWQRLDSPYVYQHIHTLAHKARHSSENLRIVNETASRLWGLQCDITRRELEQEIEQLLIANHISRNTSVEVTLKLYSTADYTLEVGESSIYSGYVVRSLRPEASLIATSAPLTDYPTSAMVATRAMIKEMASARDLHHLIMATPDGKIIADAAEPLFIVKGHKVTLPVVAMPSVEQSLIERASISLGFEVEQKQLTVEMLQDAEEVAIASWQGITAINHIDSKPYMSIIAERIVAQMEHREKKQ